MSMGQREEEGNGAVLLMVNAALSRGRRGLVEGGTVIGFGDKEKLMKMQKHV